MAAIRPDIVSVHLLRGIEGISKVLANLMEGMAEITEVQTVHQINEKLKELAAANMPLKIEYNNIKLLVEKIEDESVREEINNILDNCVKEEMTVDEGVEELKNFVRTLNLSEETKEDTCRKLDWINERKSIMMGFNVSKYDYQNVLRNLHNQNMTHEIMDFRMADGSHLLGVPAWDSDKMEMIYQAAALMHQPYPTTEQVRIAAFCASPEAMQGEILRFENLSPELAERIVEEAASKYGNVGIAKEERIGSDPPRYDIICAAGGDKSTKDRTYKEVMDLIIYSSLSLSGPLGDLEMQKMRHNANEHDKVMDGLKESGYVYSVIGRESKDKSGIGSYIDPSTFIKFNQTRFTAYCDGKAMKAATSYGDDPRTYENKLLREIYSGSGINAVKVFISEEQNEAFEKKASQLLTEYNNITAHIPGRDFDQVRAFLQSEIDKETADRMAKPKGERGLSEREKDLSAMLDAVSIAGKSEIKAANITERLVAKELDRHVFKPSRSSKKYSREEANAAKYAKELVRFAIRESGRDVTVENNLKITRVGEENEETKIGWEKLEAALDRVDSLDYEDMVDQFLVSKFNSEQDRETVRILLEQHYDEDTFRENIRDAADMMRDISVCMIVEQNLEIPQMPAYVINREMLKGIMNDMDGRETDTDQNIPGYSRRERETPERSR